MTPHDFLLHLFCLVDDELQALHPGRLRTRGPAPTLADSERNDWGLDRDSLQQINSDLVVVRVSDYGQEGPRRGQPSTSLTLQAASGWPTEVRPSVSSRVRLTVAIRRWSHWSPAAWPW